MSFEIRDGFLHKDGKKVFAVGESYYPSFFHAKYPVPPDGDRIGEMKKDLALMAEAGINHVRFAALDHFSLDEAGNVVTESEFTDAMIREAEKDGISVSVRLQGYVTNLHGYRDVLMIDANGTPQDTGRWIDFIQTTLYHEGMLEDDYEHARVLAQHFTRFPNVVGFQIYNEPHFPGKTAFDYHPLAIEAYRKWLVTRGYFTEEEARDYEPPHTREEKTPREWALWRVFGEESINTFLKNAADGARAGSPLPVYTCFTNDMDIARATTRGVDKFGGAEVMDLVGYTDYTYAEGTEYFRKAEIAMTDVDAAYALGKQAWNIELDCRMTLPPRLFSKGIYTTIGTGVRGILFYAWRGDVPTEGSPESDSFGIVHYDGRKSEHYDSAVRNFRFLNRISDLLVNTVPAYQGIAVFYSSYALAMRDAVEMKGSEAPVNVTLTNSALLVYRNTVEQLLTAGYRPAIVNRRTLLSDAFSSLRICFAPNRTLLSEEDAAALAAFEERGGTVYYNYRFGYLRSSEEPRGETLASSNHVVPRRIDELLLDFPETPFAVADTPLLQTLSAKGPDYDLITLVNLAVDRILPGPLRLRTTSTYRHAVLETVEGTFPLEKTGNVVTIADPSLVEAGGVLVLRN